MEEKCRNCDEKQACIPFFAHENTMMHYNHANRRMLIALIAVCITFILTIVIFVRGYTIREKNWLDTLQRLQVTEAEDGVHQNQKNRHSRFLPHQHHPFGGHLPSMHIFSEKSRSRNEKNDIFLLKLKKPPTPAAFP